MKRKKMLFIFNPFSGKGLLKTKLYEVIDIFVKNDYEVTVYPTQAVMDGFDKVRKSEGKYSMVVCSGGDGTLDEVISGMMHCEIKVPIGYIPTGSTNDFANSLKIPKNITKAATIAVKGKKFPCDIGAFNGDFFVYIAAFGIFTDVSYQTKQELKNVLGHLAYILEGARRVASIKSYPMVVEWDGNTIEDDFIYGMVSNSLSVGGFKNMTGKNVKLDDGLFEVTLIRNPKNPVEMQMLISNLLLGVAESEYIYSFKTSSLSIKAKTVMPWTLDGEFGGDHQTVSIVNINKAVEIMVKEY